MVAVSMTCGLPMFHFRHAIAPCTVPTTCCFCIPAWPTFLSGANYADGAEYDLASNQVPEVVSRHEAEVAIDSTA